MFITEAYRLLVSVKLYGAEKSGVSAEQVNAAKTVVTDHIASDALYRKVLRDLAKMGR
jgi:hypothetical protein